MKINKELGAVLLIAGTSIGAGMIALPVTTASAGFFPSIALLIVCWLAMYLCGLYVLEVNLWFPAGANLITMTRNTLGRLAEAVAWLVYLLLLYSLMAAYLSGGGSLVLAVLDTAFTLPSSGWLGPLPWVIVVGAIIYLGIKRIDGVNRLLVIGLLASYIALVLTTAPHVQLVNLTEWHPGALWLAVPVVVTSFGYQVIIPSIRNYLNSQTPLLPKVIFWGSSLPLLVYLVWELKVFGTIPMHGELSLMTVVESGQPAAALPKILAVVTGSHWLQTVSQFFIFFAIASSFLGISMSLFDFLIDGLPISRTALGRLAVVLITFIPPLVYAWVFPRGFVLALGYAGAFIAILHGILPALMVLVGRSKPYAKAAAYRAPGGRIGLVLILVFSWAIIATLLAGKL